MKLTHFKKLVAIALVCVMAVVALSGCKDAVSTASIARMMNDLSSVEDREVEENAKITAALKSALPKLKAMYEEDPASVIDEEDKGRSTSAAACLLKDALEAEGVTTTGKMIWLTSVPTKDRNLTKQVAGLMREPYDAFVIQGDIENQEAGRKRELGTVVISGFGFDEVTGASITEKETVRIALFVADAVDSQGSLHP